MLFNEVADIMWFDLVNSKTSKDLWNEIQGLSSTCPVFKYFHKALNLGEKIQGLSTMRGNPAHQIVTDMSYFATDCPQTRWFVPTQYRYH